jgi:hypothetical protein
MNAPARAFIAALAIAGVAAWPGASPAQEPSIASSVVSLDVVSDVPDLTTPWQSEGIAYFGGSGVIMGTKKVIDVDTYYDLERLRPKYKAFAGMPLFIMTSDA